MIDVYIRWMHKIAPRADDVEGPFKVDRERLRTKAGVLAFLRKVLGSGAGRLSDFRITPDGAILCFNPSSFPTMHGIYIEPPGACSVERYGSAKSVIDAKG